MVDLCYRRKVAVCTNSASDGGKWDQPVDVRNRFEPECDFSNYGTTGMHVRGRKNSIYPFLL